MTKQDFNLHSAFPAMPAECRNALSAAARSVKEEEKPMRRKYPVAILVAAILTLMTTIAIAEGWNVLQFLGIQPDSDAQTLVQPVSASASVDNCSIRIDSAITDGEYLAFDYSVTHTKPETPIFIRVEQFTANGEMIWTDGTDDVHNQWMPGHWNKSVWQDGEWCQLPCDLTGDLLHVEMVVAVYTPEKPVYQMEGFDAAAIQQKWDEGYYVIVDGDGMIFYDEEEQRLVQGFPGRVLDYEEQGLLRSEMKVSFDLDLKAARASVRHPELPASVTKDDTTFAVQSISISPLQTRIVATIAPENASYEDITAWCQDYGDFFFYDADGNEIKWWDLCVLMPQWEITVEEAPDGTWFLQLDYSMIEVEQTLPDTIYLVFKKESGFCMELPVTIK